MKVTGCAITGGAFYNPTTRQFPRGYVGDYFFADLCSGWIRRLDAATGDVSGFATELSSSVALKVSKGGSLYYLSRGGGEWLERFATQAPRRYNVRHHD